MLHIILLILKILGIVLAVLLGIILLILVLLLYVPVRYQGTVRRDKAWELYAKLSWLLHSLTVPIVYEDGKFSIKVRLFGITIKDLSRDEEEISEDIDEYLWDAEEDISENEEQIEDRSRLSAGEDGLEERAKPVQPEREDWDLREPEDEETKGRDMEARQEKGLLSRVWEKIRTIFLKIFRIWQKIKNLKYTFCRICAKIRQGVQKYRDLKEFLLDERTKKAVKQCLEQLKYLLGKLLPKKIRGELHFGMEDPALTGEILGGISIFYPVFMDNVKVYPDFEQSILEGELFIKGRLRLITILLILWRLWRDRDVRYVYEKLNGRRAGKT